MKPLVGLYSFVLSLWVASSSSVNPVSSSSDPCHISAWVRAPDLDPGQIISGQVRVKVNGTCDPISEYSLILRFKERAWVKLPKPNITPPQEPEIHNICGNVSKIDLNILWGKYAKDMRDPSLWDFIEEERIAFESRYRLNEDISSSLLAKGLTHDFAILIPTTNYPPTLSTNYIPIMSAIKNGDTAEKNHEHIYLYTVEIKFGNGTTIEVPAGYTAFNPTGRNDNPGPEVITANLTQEFSSSNDLNASLVINVTFPHGRTLEQGSTHNLTFTLCDRIQVSGSTHTNYSLVLGPPRIDIHTLSRDHWIQTLSPMHNYTMSSRFASSQLSSTSSPSERTDQYGGSCRFGQEDDTTTWNLSTSKSLQITPKAFPSFDMHYGSFESQISISISVSVPIQETMDQPQMFDEEFYWVPTRAPKKKNKISMSFTTEIPITVSANVKLNTPMTHYLSSHARRPLFIDQSTIKGLSQLSIEERDFLAPKSAPIIKRNTDNVVRERYNAKSLYYVGDTWHRKVLNQVFRSDVSDRDGIFGLWVQD